MAARKKSINVDRTAFHAYGRCAEHDPDLQVIFGSKLGKILSLYCDRMGTCPAFLIGSLLTFFSTAMSRCTYKAHKSSKAARCNIHVALVGLGGTGKTSTTEFVRELEATAIELIKSFTHMENITKAAMAELLVEGKVGFLSLDCDYSGMKSLMASQGYKPKRFVCDKLFTDSVITVVNKKAGTEDTKNVYLSSISTVYPQALGSFFKSETQINTILYDHCLIFSGRTRFSLLEDVGKAIDQLRDMGVVVHEVLKQIYVHIALANAHDAEYQFDAEIAENIKPTSSRKRRRSPGGAGDDRHAKLSPSGHTNMIRVTMIIEAINRAFAKVDSKELPIAEQSGKTVVMSPHSYDAARLITDYCEKCRAEYWTAVHADHV